LSTLTRETKLGSHGTKEMGKIAHQIFKGHLKCHFQTNGIVIFQWQNSYKTH